MKISSGFSGVLKMLILNLRDIKLSLDMFPDDFSNSLDFQDLKEISSLYITNDQGYFKNKNILLQ